MDLSKITFIIEGQEDVLKELETRQRAWMQKGSADVAFLLRKIAINADLKGLSAEVFDEMVKNKKFSVTFRLSRWIERIGIVDPDSSVRITGDLIFTQIKNGDVIAFISVSDGDEKTTVNYMQFDPSETTSEDYDKIVEGAVLELITAITTKIIGK